MDQYINEISLVHLEIFSYRVKLNHTHTHTIHIHIYTQYVCDVYMLKSSMINYTYHHYLYAAQLTKRQHRITLNS